jgi:predicted ribosome quality control (RQC) complex YloA/Tae2 family protein
MAESLLVGAIVRRVDIADAVAALEVRSPGETRVIVMGIARGLRGVGLVSSEERRAAWETRLPAGAPRTRGGAGAQIEGGRVVGLSPRAVEIEAGGASFLVALGPLRVTVAPGTVEAPDGEDARDAYEARGKELLAALRAEAHERRRDAIVRAIQRGMLKIERRIGAMRGDLARLADAEALAAQAQWLVAAAVRAPRGATSLEVTDWSTGEARPLVVPLDPAKPARAQVDAMFQRARRLKRGAQIAEERIAKASAIVTGLAAALEHARALAIGEGAALDAAFAKARALAPKDIALDASRQGSAGSTAAPKQVKGAPFRTFVTPGGARVLVGKGAAQNDQLTFQNARPHDLWLHAKGRTGAHVVVPLAKNTTCPGELLVDAAHLAAHFSEARGDAVVEVQYTPRRYLRKPRGSAPGLVVVDREKVLPVRLEPGRVERLLEGEE